MIFLEVVLCLDEAVGLYVMDFGHNLNGPREPSTHAKTLYRFTPHTLFISNKTQFQLLYQ